MTTDASNRTAFETVNLLQHRLRRIEFLLTGYDDGQEQLERLAIQGRDDTLTLRLARAENNMARLASNSSVVHNLLALCKLMICLKR